MIQVPNKAMKPTGAICKACYGTGKVAHGKDWVTCPTCRGKGRIGGIITK